MTKVIPKELEGELSIPMNIKKKDRSYVGKICNFTNKCIRKDTNSCNFCIKNYSTWIVLKAGKRTPHYTSDFYIEVPPNQ